MSRSYVVLLALAILPWATHLEAQNPTPSMPAGPGVILGKVVDSVSARGLPTASITVRRVGDSSFASGALAKEDGTFRVEGLSLGTYVVRVRTMGFAPAVR